MHLIYPCGRIKCTVTVILSPDSYLSSQLLGQQLLDAGSLGLVYPSVRAPGGTCLACFRPVLVGNVRKAATYVFRWTGQPEPEIAIREG